MPIALTDLEFHQSSTTLNSPSLGGAISATLITSGAANNLWDNVTSGESTSGDTEYRCIYIKNTNATLTWTNPVVWIDGIPAIGSAAIALDATAADSGADTTSHITGSDASAPSPALSWHATTDGTPPTTKPNGLAITENIGPGQAKAIWLRRTIPAGNPTTNPADAISIHAEGDSGATIYVLPADRATTWNPGLNPVGGIPARSTIYTTVNPSGDTTGATDVANINNALTACPANQVVKLAAGTFYIPWNNFIQITQSNITLRGAGPGTGNMGVSGTQQVGGGTGTFLVKTATPSGSTGYPVVIIGPQWGPNGTATNLTADAARGSYTATVASTAGLSVGGLVIINQVNGTTTVAAASNGVNVNTFTGSGTLNVASTTNFPTLGWVSVVTSAGNALISYTGITGTTFTGGAFLAGQAGTMATGAAVIDTTLSHWNTTDPENASGWFEEANRPIGDTLEIQSISGNTITFSTPLHIDYKTTHAAHLYPLTTPVKYSGLEEVYCYNGTGGDGGGGIHMWNAGYCWVKHIEDTWSVGAAIHIDQCFQCEIRDSYFHDSENGLFSGGANYGIGMSWYTANTLIENTISVKFNKCMVMRSAGGGNVIGYNYMDDGADSGGSWFETIINSSHMTTPHYELFEGNQGANFDQDDRWGNSAYITIFRNQFTGQLRDYPAASPTRAAGVVQWHWWQSFVGNVLGTSGQTWATGGYEVFDETSGYMWMVAYHSSSTETVNDGGRCLATLLRDGNFDYKTGQVHWHGIGGTGAGNGLTPPVNHTLPDSLYLSGKPGFFGSSTWPWVDGSNASTPLPGTLPARTRYNASTPNSL